MTISDRGKWPAFALVVTLAFLLRGFALDRLVTPDEKRWLFRSGNFYQALVYGDLARTYQFVHPGVTTMWIGTAGYLLTYPGFAREVERQQARENIEIRLVLRALGREPIDILAAARRVMAGAVVLALAAAFLAGVRLFGLLPALLGFLFIAADPFHIAHSRLLHLDGLVSSLMLLSLLAFLNYLYHGRRRRDFVLSAAAAGLACLTKSTAIFLVPFAGLLFWLELVFNRQPRLILRLWPAARPFIAWTGAALVVYVLLWPAMWVAPLSTTIQVLRGLAGYAVEGHENLLYFAGTVLEDPGPLFYPTAFLWRTTAPVLAGLAACLVLLFLPQARGRLEPAQRRSLAALLLFAVLYTVAMSLPAKKFDRYLLPVFPVADLAAGVGLAAAARWFFRRWPARPVQFAVTALLLLFVPGQVGIAISGFPYYLSTYNALLGGTTRAPEVLMVGWGEGLDQAARYLRDLPGEPSPPVIAGVWEGAFSFFYDGPIFDSSFIPGADTLSQWESADYCILYIDQLLRAQVPGELVSYLSNLSPARVIRLQGLEYVTIYDIRDVPPPAYLRQ